MLELLINPRKAKQHPWEMLIVGFFYAALAAGLGYWMGSGNPVLAPYSGIFMIMFCVIFSLPYMYYAIKMEEKKDLVCDEELTLLKEHGKALLTFLFLFLGFVIAFAIAYINLNMLTFTVIFILPLILTGYELLKSFLNADEEKIKKYTHLIIAIAWLIAGLVLNLYMFNDLSTPNSQNLFKAQIETFCQINGGDSYLDCVKQYNTPSSVRITGGITSTERLFNIFANNIYVLIFTLGLSLIFGAGAIFILAWNASVIAAAIGIFVKNDLSQLHLGFMRYLAFHGLLEIAAYFVAALAGGILSIAIIKHDTQSEKFWSIVQDSLNLVIIAIGILLMAALIEVFITPALFS